MELSQGVAVEQIGSQHILQMIRCYSLPLSCTFVSNNAISCTLSDFMMTHEPLIQSFTLFLNTLARLCYIDASDIIEPPVNIEVRAAENAGLSREVISLIQCLPSLSSDLYDRQLLPDGTRPVFYKDNDLWFARRPSLQDEPEIPGTQFVLSNANMYGTALIYDTETCKLQAWKPFDPDSAISLDQAQPPEQLTGGWIKELISLEWLPSGEYEFILDPTATKLEEAHSGST